MEILIKELDPGQKYIFQARAKSATGKTSSWSTAFEHTTQSDTIAPSPVTGLNWDSVGTSFVATWTKPLTDSNGKPLKDFKDYKVIITAGVESVTYYVAQEKFDFSLEANRNSFGSPEPDLDISVQVRDNTGNLSTAVVANAVNPIPANVTGLVADGVSNGVTLSWNSVADADLKYYEVYMSTSGSGFTPGPANLVYTGASTSFLFPSTNFITHYFKVRAVDVFDQGSASYASASGTPESSSGIDLTPPDDPTNVLVTTAASADGSSTITVDWDAVVSSNLSDYLVRYSTDEVAWRYINVPSTQTVALISNLLAATNYYVQVAAMSQANVKSDFVNANVYPITTAADTTAPSQPAAPTVSTTTLAVQVSHDMTKQGGGDLEGDVAYLEVHASTTTGFTPDNTTLRGTIDTAGPGIDVSGVFYFPATDATTNLYWKVIAVDRSKNKSVASNQATGVPGLVLNANIGDATITSAKIQSLEANKLTAGTGIINNLSIKSTLTIDTAGSLQSANWNNIDTGYKLDTGGLTIYSGSVAAAALLLQDSANIIPPAFADFEFNEDYYHTGGVANTVVWSTVGTGVNVDILETGQRFGNKCLRVSNGAITNPTVHDLVLAPGGLAASDVNIDVSPGTYIFSGYFKKNGSVDALVKFGFYTEAGAAVTSSTVTVNSTSWTRFEAQLVVPSGVSKVKAYLEFGPAVSNTGYDMLIDGLQVERKMTGATAAGPWRAPSRTAIDGGQIVTGSIRSSAASPTVPSQPAWSINTAGNMQIGDALVRGSITVGPSTAKVNIMPSQFASFENVSTYYHYASNAPYDSNFDAFDPGNTTGKVAIVTTSPMFGTQAMRVWDTGIPVSGDSGGIGFSNNYLNAAGNNIPIIGGQTYIVSGYIKNNNGAKQLNVQWTGYTDDANWVFIGSPVNISTSTSSYTRVYGSWTPPAGKTTGQIVLWVSPIGGTNGYDIIIDGLQVEKAEVGQTTPSTWVEDVSELSYVRSGNYSPGYSGWSIANDGNVEFNDGLFRGSVDVQSQFNNETSGVSLYNAPSVWKAFNFPVQSQIEGITPVVRFYGKAFKTAANGSLLSGDPYQVVFRGTPEGGYQLMFDGTNTDKIFRIDGGYSTNEAFGAENSLSGFSDLRAGRGYDRNWASLTNTGYLDRNNIYYSQLQTTTRTPSPQLTWEDTGIWSLSESSTASSDFRPFTHTKQYSNSRMIMTSQNIIPDGWDIFDGSAATLNTNSTKNRITVGSIVTNIYSIGGSAINDGTANLLKGLQLTLLLAGTGNHLMYLSSSATTYNITVEPGCKYSMSFQFGLPTSLIGKQFRYVMKLSNGTTLTSSTKTLTADETTSDIAFVSTGLEMRDTDEFTIPAGITTCLVGFELIGGVAANTVINMCSGHLYKTTNADGTKTSSYSPYLQQPVGKNYDIYETAEVITATGTLNLDFPNRYSDNDLQWGSRVALYAEHHDVNTATVTSTSFTVNPFGAIIEGGFIKISMEDWANVIIDSGSGFVGNPLQVKLLPDGTAIFRGGISGHGTSSTNGVNTQIAHLPSSKYYPPTTLRFVLACENYQGQYNIVSVNTSGQILVAARLTGNGGPNANNTWFTGLMYSTV